MRDDHRRLYYPDVDAADHMHSCVPGSVLSSEPPSLENVLQRWVQHPEEFTTGDNMTQTCPEARTRRLERRMNDDDDHRRLYYPDVDAADHMHSCVPGSVLKPSDIMQRWMQHPEQFEDSREEWRARGARQGAVWQAQLNMTVEKMAELVGCGAPNDLLNTLQQYREACTTDNMQLRWAALADAYASFDNWLARIAVDARTKR